MSKIIGYADMPREDGSIERVKLMLTDDEDDPFPDLDNSSHTERPSHPVARMMWDMFNTYVRRLESMNYLYGGDWAAYDSMGRTHMYLSDNGVFLYDGETDLRIIMGRTLHQL